MSTNFTKKLAGKVALVTGGSRGIGVANFLHGAARGSSDAPPVASAPSRTEHFPHGNTIRSFHPRPPEDQGKEAVQAVEACQIRARIHQGQSVHVGPQDRTGSTGEPVFLPKLIHELLRRSDG